MRRILIGLALSIFASHSFAESSDADLAARATAEFEAGVRNRSRVLLARKHFTAAADAYLTLHQRGNRNTELYRGLGNTLVLADRWPEAIWAYQMGLAYAPDDASMRRQLAELRSKVLISADGNGRLPADRWPTWLPRMTVRNFWLISILSYLCLCSAAVALRLRPTRRRVGLLIVTSSISMLATLGLWLAFQHQRIDRETPVAVIIENVPFRTGNSATYPQHQKVPAIPRGLEARLLHQRSGWLQVTLSTDEIGWIPQAAASIVEK